MAPNRVLAAADCRIGVAAGTMDSRNGKAIVTPAPWRKVRRERCFLVMNAIVQLLFGIFLHLHLLLKRIALNNPKRERREPVVIRGCPPDDGANTWHVIVFQRPASRICQKLLCGRRDEHLAS